ncbi:hypothetical protein RBB75_00145 [Tunturibacter empetritectus]|uniref:Tetratricopeptide repeat protein n=1 Tax=Tunturiibacter empetritectus TaxID=3069691 RepID=A0AAU7ZCZ6_9BACT
MERASFAARIAFENGIRLDNSFSQEEAIRAFMLAEHLDPGCAMCYWGEASALAPTINYTIASSEAARAVEALSHAQALAISLSPKANAIITAEQQRYVMRDRSWTVDGEAGAKAADALADIFPIDDFLQVSAANAEMIAAENGVPGSASAKDPHLVKAQAHLETVLHRNPTYTPAIHFYLHLTEWQDRPAASLQYANRLASLAPASGHMLHMSSHIDYRTGEYEAAAQANMAAVLADIGYVEKMQPPGGMASIPMHLHNLLFGLVSSLISGDKNLALSFADEMQRSSPPQSLAFAESYLAFGRFLPVEDVLNLKAPDTSLANGFYHFARGEAMIRRNDGIAAGHEAALIEDVHKTGSFEHTDPKIVAMLTVARETLNGQAAIVQKDYVSAVKEYTAAASFAEENDGYRDPPIWPWPPRRSLGEALLLQGHLREARKEIETTLLAMPNDPVSLRVLAEIAGQLLDPQSAGIQEHAAKVWFGSSDLLQPGMI